MLTLLCMNQKEQEEYAKTRQVIYMPMTFFDVKFDESWIENDFARKVIADIQQFDPPLSEESTRVWLGRNKLIPETLCTGVKNLLLCKFYKPTRASRLGMMGPNCYKYLMDIADEIELSATVTDSVLFTDTDLRGRPVLFKNTGTVAMDSKSFHRAMYEEILRGSFDNSVWLQEEYDKYAAQGLPGFVIGGSYDTD